MNKQQKQALLLGGALVGSAAVLAYFYTKNRETKKPIATSKNVSRELVIRVLKEVQREMYAVLTNVSMIANQIKEQSRGRVANQEIREFLLNHNPQTKEQIKQISDSTCEKYGLDEADLKYACEITYAEDREVKHLLAEAKSIFDKAFTGIAPDSRTDIPAFLTAEMILTFMRKIMKESLYKIQGFLNDLKKKGITISYNNPQVLMGLQDLKLDDIRKQILVEGGLDKFQDPPLKIFQFATQKYSAEDPDGFNQKLMKLELQNQKAMEALMKDAPDAPVQVEAIGAHLNKESEDLVSSHLRNTIMQKSSNAKKAGEKTIDIVEEEDQARIQIRTLQHEVSFQLKSALEENDFPEELVESAVNTLYNVFNNLNKNKQGEELKKSLTNVSPKNNQTQENVIFHAEEEKVKEFIVEKGTGEVTAVVLETQAVEVKEIHDVDGQSQLQTTTEEKITIISSDAVEEVKIEETTTENIPIETENQN